MTLALFSLLLSSAAIAAPPAPGAQPGMPQPTPEQLRVMPWLSDAYLPCRQNCHYQKANEQLAAQALFTFNRVARIDHEVSLESDPDLARGIVERNMPDFCVSGESGRSCLDRFKVVEQTRLRRIQNSIAQNNLLMTGLEQGKNDPLGDMSIDAHGSSISAQKRGSDPSMATFGELDQQYRASGAATRPRNAMQADYINWVSDSRNYMPQPTDFVKFRQIKRDPSNPNSETMTVPDTSCNQQICYDTAAYQSAVSALDPNLARQFAQMRSSVSARGVTAPPSSLSSAATGNETREAYLDARGRFVTTANDKITGRTNTITPSASGSTTAPGGPALTPPGTPPPGPATTSTARTPAGGRGGRGGRGGDTASIEMTQAARAAAANADFQNRDRAVIARPSGGGAVGDERAPVYLRLPVESIDTMMQDAAVRTSRQPAPNTGVGSGATGGATH